MKILAKKIIKFFYDHHYILSHGQFFDLVQKMRNKIFKYENVMNE